MKKFLRALLAYLSLMVSAICMFAVIISGCFVGALIFVWGKEGLLQNEDWFILRRAVAALLGSALLGFVTWWIGRRITGAVADSDSFRLTRSKSGKSERIAAKFNTAFLGLAIGIWIWNRSTAGSALFQGIETASCLTAIAAGLFVHIFLHELGHIVAAMLVGSRPLKIQIGTGPILWRHRSQHGLLWEWRIRPDGGFMSAGFSQAPGFKWRAAVMFLGGPLMDVLVLWAGYEFVIKTLWLSHSAHLHGAASSAVFALFGLLVLGALSGLFPHRIHLGNQVLFSDGAQLLGLWNMSAEAIEFIRAQSAAYEVDALLEAHKTEEARAAARRLSNTETFLRPMLEGTISKCEGHYARASASFASALKHSSTPEQFRPYLASEVAGCLVKNGDTEGAVQICTEMIANVSPEKKVAVLDTFASIPVLQNAPELLPHAQQWCSEALALSPDSLTLQGTYGSLLVEEGRFSEGETLLRKVIDRSESTRDRGIASYFLSVVVAQDANRARETHRLRTRALDLCPERWLRARAAS